MDLFHVRGDNHKPQADPLPGALPALWRHNVPDLAAALPGNAKGFGALRKTGGTIPAPRGGRPPDLRGGPALGTPAMRAP
jgi:hypothetical protein